MSVQVGVARALLALGRSVSDRAFVLLDAAVGLVALGRWLHREGHPVPPHLSSREALFAHAASRIVGPRFLYLEFGVHEGASLKTWTALVPAPDARFVGFDSFEGLPELWNDQHAKAHFSTEGRLPVIEDERVELVVGWFEDTLPAWSPPPHEQVLLALDADLYSSTRTVLESLRGLLKPGTLLYFDELNDHEHELRALRELVQSSPVEVTPLAAAGRYRHWLFEVTRA